jgi:predicted HNH restriction endonuclease
MNIYEMTIQKFSEFTGEKLVIWESNNSKIWMEANKDSVIYVYIMKNKEVSSYRWEIGQLKVLKTFLMKYQLNPETMLKIGYEKWVKQVSA